MILDDIDAQFDGCEDRYWICESCKASCFEKVRYHKSIGRAFEPPEYAHHSIDLVGDLLKCRHCELELPQKFYGVQQLEKMFCEKAFEKGYNRLKEEQGE